LKTISELFLADIGTRSGFQDYYKNYDSPQNPTSIDFRDHERVYGRQATVSMARRGRPCRMIGHGQRRLKIELQKRATTL
jgi:hypothetical protein